jgi:hypothetical protein
MTNSKFGDEQVLETILQNITALEILRAPHSARAKLPSLASVAC